MEVKLGKDILILKPDFERLVEIEEAAGGNAGGGIPAMLRRFASREFRLKDVAAVYFGGSGGALEFNEIGNRIMKDGLRDHANNAAAFISDAITPEQKEDASALGKEPTPTPPPST